eukprot:TRINITY_DN4960_c0_g1_i2.p2 TRINITY_DN4960_c0_g1~~TRINITY_DN4960_c0_g1_i2.p2  ORF type:complete len:144 (+),score=15.82 TRINITY_DN4960_c0_g1_i2:353-784(+)
MTDSISFKVVYAKKPYVITNLQKDSTVGELKAHLHELTGLPPATQKLLKGGILKDDTKTLQEVKVTEGCKVMLVGTKIADMLTVATVETDNSKKGSFEGKASAGSSTSAIVHSPSCSSVRRSMPVGHGPTQVPSSSAPFTSHL